MVEGSSLENWRTLTGTVGSNPTLTATQSRVAETSRASSGTARENHPIPRGLGRHALAYANRRLGIRGPKDAAARGFLCCQVGRFGFAFDSPRRRARLGR